MHVARLPLPVVPPIALWRDLISDAILIGIVSYVITVSLGRLFAAQYNYEIDANQVFNSSLFSSLFLSSFLNVYSTFLSTILVIIQLPRIWII